MKKIIFITLVFSLLLVSFVRKSNTSKTIFYNSVWSIIDNNDSINSPIFFPTNEISLIEPDRDGIYESEYRYAFNKLKKESIKWNLWSIISYSIYKGNLPIYYPFNPFWFEDKDNGFLKFPLAKSDLDFSLVNNFNDSIVLLDYEILGFYGVESDMPLSNEFGEDMIDDNGNYVYPSKEQFWYSDKDIIKYKIKENWTYNKKGKVIKKEISAIAPMIYKVDEDLDSVGEKILFWIDFKDLDLILKNYYIKEYNKKTIKSYSEYFNKTLYNSTIVERDTNYIFKK